MHSGLAYLSLRPYTNAEWDELTHIHLTSDDDWDTSVFDHAYDEDDDTWYDA